jgi:hypothetical protein
MPNAGAVGNKAGVIVVPAITTASHRYTFWWTQGTVGGSQIPFGWKSMTFQLVPGNMSAGTVEIDVSIELATAQGTNANWEPIVAPGGNSFSFNNPLSQNPGQRLLQIASGPWLAFSALTSSDDVGTTAYLSSLQRLHRQLAERRHGCNRKHRDVWCRLLELGATVYAPQRDDLQQRYRRVVRCCDGDR